MDLVTLGKKGQVSVEFILLVTISLVYINFFIWDSVETASQTTADIKAISDAKVSSMKLANSLNEAASSSGDMKRKINLLVPANSEITCNTAENKIEYSVMVSHLNWNPDETNCVEEIEEMEPIGWTCTSSVELLPAVAAGLPEGCPAMNTPQFRTLILQKENATISLDWE